MAQGEDEPKLAAPLAAELQGCSQLVGKDEGLICAALRVRRKEPIEHNTSDNHGCLVN